MIYFLSMLQNTLPMNYDLPIKNTMQGYGATSAQRTQGNNGIIANNG